jgi:predicted flap endonuclease-1-like 5' DNA nuclease
MNELVMQNWWLLVAALLIGIVVAWWIFAINDRTRVETKLARDVLDEGAAPAERNKALIDAPPAAAKIDTTPAAAAEPAPSSQGDDLTRLKGVGPKLSGLLQTLGVSTFAQVASWSDEDIDRIDAQLGNFSGRIRRDNWPEQARFLANGDTQGFEDKFGKL